MADHKPGTMNIKAQEATFNSFIGFVKWGVIIVLAVLIFMALVNA
jgi:hypothetical protein